MIDFLGNVALCAGYAALFAIMSVVVVGCIMILVFFVKWCKEVMDELKRSKHE